MWCLFCVSAVLCVCAATTDKWCKISYLVHAAPQIQVQADTNTSLFAPQRKSGAKISESYFTCATSDPCQGSLCLDRVLGQACCLGPRLGEFMRGGGEHLLTRRAAEKPAEQQRRIATNSFQSQLEKPKRAVLMTCEADSARPCRRTRQAPLLMRGQTTSNPL